MNRKPIRPQPGRMLKWHRRASYLILALCSVSGVGWFVLLITTNWMPPQLKPWWIAHGTTGLAAMIILGAAIPQHVIVTWRTKRNRLAGASCLLCATFLTVSAGLLFYAPETFRSSVFWLHSTAGFALCLVFPLHIINGKLSKPTMPLL